MGLDCSHNAWHGAYSAFMRWRTKLAEVAGLPPLELMDGFYASLDTRSAGIPTLYHGINTQDKAFGPNSGRHMDNLDSRLPISWNCLNPSPLHELLYHSDCEGEIAADKCGAIADALEELIPLLPEGEAGGHIGIWRDKTAQFVAGLRAAAAAGEALVFH